MTVKMLVLTATWVIASVIVLIAVILKIWGK